MTTQVIGISRSHAVAFTLGLSVSMALVMCGDLGAKPTDLELRVAALEAVKVLWKKRFCPQT